MCKIHCYILVAFNVVGVFLATSENFEKSLRTLEFGEFCDETITEPKFFLISSKYPGSYAANLDCRIKLESRNCPSYYKFQFIDFLIEESNGCVKDRLEIGFLDALCGRRNGTKSYLSKNGTLTLRFKTNDQISERGFKILVTRIEECLENPPDLRRTTVVTRINSSLKECCVRDAQNSRHFLLKSPNFPASMSFPNDCIIQIHKATPDVCRLRITFQFFWLGNSLDCNEGFLQIDGKVICGCKKDLKLISKFDENVKVLRFKSVGLVENSYSGFIAEVFQDDCPKKVRKSIEDAVPQKKENLTYFSPSASNAGEGYFYPIPGEKLSGEDKEENDFLATEEIDGILRNEVGSFQDCLQWNQAQFDEIFYGKEIRLEQCGSAKREIQEEKRCLRFLERRGFFFSPGYPFFYPGNLRMCYRFERLPGSCGVRIHFFDFRIHHSEGCSQDRFEIDERPYCGVQLWNKIVNLDLRNRNFVDLDFITSTPKCVQGFKAYYEYLKCDETTTESPPPPPITKILPVPPPITERPHQKCGGAVKEEIFTLHDVGGSQECVFVIEKFTEEICQLVLKFERIPTDCTSEQVRINGKTYCGNQYGGTEVFIDGTEFPVEIAYSRFRSNGNGFKIRGIQDTLSCLIPEPPAQLS